MSQIKPLAIDSLKLDLHNYRTVPQKSEEKSVHALISIDPEWFWALTESLLEDGWHGTENVLVLENGKECIVKEGNRRIGAIKLVLGKFKLEHFDIPPGIKAKIEAASAEWKTTNAEVPCNIFNTGEKEQVEKLVGLAHAKGEKAGRLKWNAVARARYKRDEEDGSEPALDLLEQYLKSGKNIDATQKERWGGEYPLTILDEALKKLAPRIGLADARAAVTEYPKTSKYLSEIESMLHDIGAGVLTFPIMRNQSVDFLAKYGFPVAPAPAAPTSGGIPAGASAGTPSVGTAGGAPAAIGGSSSSSGKGVKTLSLSDPKSVRRELRRFAPKGKSSSKVVDLLFEAKKLNLEDTPIAFCFLFSPSLVRNVQV